MLQCPRHAVVLPYHIALIYAHGHTSRSERSIAASSIAMLEVKARSRGTRGSPFGQPCWLFGTPSSLCSTGTNGSSRTELWIAKPAWKTLRPHIGQLLPGFLSCCQGRAALLRVLAYHVASKVAKAAQHMQGERAQTNLLTSRTISIGNQVLALKGQGPETLNRSDLAGRKPKARCRTVGLSAGRGSWRM